MHTVKIEYKDEVITREIPEKWDELTTVQLEFIVEKLFEKTNLLQARDEIMVYLLKLKPKYYKPMNQSQFDGLLPGINYLFEAIDLVKNPLPQLRINGDRYTGPKDKLKNISFFQFMYCDTCYINYHKEKDNTWLDKMMATLYFQKGTKFNDKKQEAREERMQSVPLKKKLMVLCLFMGCRQFIIEKHPNLFPKSNTVSAEKSNFNWGDVLIDMVGDKPADKQKVEKLDLYFALRYLDKRIKDAQDLKDKLKK